MAGSGSDVKECWYSVLGVERTATPEEIRSAYRKEAMKWHPDKIQQSGASPKECQEATVRFQNIVQAYEVLSDPVERSWYDKYRSEILSSGSASKDFEFNVFSFFSPSAFSGFGVTGKGFYKVYKDVFFTIHKKEQAYAKAYGMGPLGEAPAIGTPTSPYAEVDEFYKYWTGFKTVKNFSWCDEYQVSQAPNRKVRRLMEEENANTRNRKRREYTDAVRDLATFVKKRDKRWLARQVELQRIQKEKDLQFKIRKQKLQQEKVAKAQAYQEQEWTKIPNTAFDEDDGIEDINEGSYGWKSGNNKETEDEDLEEFYCIICSKRFRSEKQWKNHEKSKKHIERASALKQSFLDEDEQVDALVKDVDLGSDTDEIAVGQRRMTTGDSVVMSRMKGEETEELAQSRSIPEGGGAYFPGTATGCSENLQEKSTLLEPTASSVHREVEEEGGDESEDDETLGNDDEDSILAAMTNSLKSRLAVPSAEFEAPQDAQERLDESGEQSAESSSSDLDGNSSNVVDGNDGDEESMLASMLKSCKIQSRFLSGERSVTENPGTAKISTPEAGSTQFGKEEKEERNSNGNLGKRNGRRRSKAEKQHMAVGERYDVLLKELFSTAGKGEAVQNYNSDGEAEKLELGANPSVEGSENSLNSMKKKLQRGQKKGKLEGVAKQGLSKTGQVAAAAPQQSEHMGKKSSAKGKKGKGAARPASNTCDTCGEDFDSRTQLFRHISLTNHATLKSRYSFASCMPFDCQCVSLHGLKVKRVWTLEKATPFRGS